MTFVKNFNEFLFEREIHTGMANGISDFLQGILVNAKKEKLLKRVKGYNDSDMNYGNPPAWVRNIDWGHLSVPTGTKKYDSGYVSKGVEALEVDKHYKNYLPAYVIQLNDGQIIETVSLTKHEETKHGIADNDAIRVLVTSEKPLDLKTIENLIPDTVVSSYKNTVYTGTRSTITDSSKISVKTGNIKAHRYYIVFEYKLTVSSGESVTAQQVIDSAAMKALLAELPLKVISTKKQINNGTVVLAVPSEYVIDPNEDDNSKYLSTCYGLYSAGYVRRLSSADESGLESWNRTQPQMIGKFNAATLKGWEEGISKVKDLFMKTFTAIEKSGGKVLYTAEDRHNKRGVIAGRKFGV